MSKLKRKKPKKELPTQDHQVAFRINKELKDRVDKFAEKNEMKLSDAIRRLLKKGLEEH